METHPSATAATPVIPGFHPDPSVCRVGEDYYLVCSSFEYFPGIPVFHSRDLVNWTQIGNALDRPGQLDLPVDTPSSGGIYAPTLRHHDGRFWLAVFNVAPGGGTLLFTTTDPAGPWSDPVRVPGVTGIDPDLVWDEDGTCWCTTAGIAQVRIDPRTGETLGTPHPVWSGTPGTAAPEGPHLYRIGDYWYLMISEGGTERGHGVSIARGPSPAGPFEPCPANPILTHRSTDRPVQNTGHADLVQAADGSWWMVLLGVRPQGGTPGWHILGRETFLAPVTWEDGWPVVGEVGGELPRSPGLEVPAPAAGGRDDFEPGGLAPYWISLRDRPAECVTTKERDSWLTLRARGGSLDEPDVIFVGRRQQHLAFQARSLVDPSEGRGGLAVRLDERHHYSVEAGPDGRITVIARIGSLRSVAAELTLPTQLLVLTVRTGPAPEPHDSRTGPDSLVFGIETADGTVNELASLDGRYLSTEVAGGFTGRVVGLYAAAGTVHADWFEYLPISG
ncbi:glycoside hydrolase family 43 protein [Streptomyces sp. S.PNR 29]|uniref:glycoside hydrolase family 43 protein n=1 Tax=Streptomyces sp. S.PNR 29 TaxID=2973805 RepID=UPI0025B02621|nr:glycoside hydrolase family 43 protein [Streptomyces sp. S.PNR 29]MDN0198904.1 glycoside hydrolase family 43 protein [Streptomyces sp. S.PNR 29]